MDQEDQTRHAHDHEKTLVPKWDQQHVRIEARADDVNNVGELAQVEKEAWSRLPKSLLLGWLVTCRFIEK